MVDVAEGLLADSVSVVIAPATKNWIECIDDCFRFCTYVLLQPGPDSDWKPAGPGTGAYGAVGDVAVEHEVLGGELGPDAVGAAKVRDAGLSGDTGSSEDHDAFCVEQGRWTDTRAGQATGGEFVSTGVVEIWIREPDY